ncbi:MAG: DUF2029 domain-containing protein [Rubrobacter sp.]|nr:DUF2029 domain-containing protein [Rubrobacter sp.]
MKSAIRPLFILLLLPLLLGFAQGPQLSELQVRERVERAPVVSEFVSKPTVEISTYYDSGLDAWKVLLREDASDTVIVTLEVSDDTGRVKRVDISPRARAIEYPDLSEDEAIKLAFADPNIRDWLTHYDSYSAEADYEAGDWTVHYRTEEEKGDVGGVYNEDTGEKEIARVTVDDDTWVLEDVYTGDQVGWQMARGEYGSYGKQANYWFVWGPMALLFALAFWRLDKLFSLRNLDIIALLGFLVSHGFFRAGDSFDAVVLWYPPLIYLFIRTLLMGFGIGERVEKTSNLPDGVLFVLAAAAAGLVLGLNLDARVIDVGYAGVVGADRILDGTLPYGHMPADVGTGDTYGPLNYVLYVPFVMMFGFTGEWGFLPAAHAMTAFAFVAGALAMLVAGLKFAGRSGAAAMVFAWTIFPYTLYSTNNNTNDIIVAAVAAVGLAMATSPIARGATVAAGFAVKLYPLILGPLWLMQGGRRRNHILDFFLGGAAVLIASFWVLFLDGNPIGGARLFYEKTLAFQGDRTSPWTIYTQVPQLGFLQTPITALVILLGFVVAVVPRKRTVRRLAAFSAALVIAFQLTVIYWFYPYVTWFEPFVFLALLTATNEKTPLDGSSQPPSAASAGQEEEAA